MTKIEHIRKLLGSCYWIAFEGLEVPKSIAEFIQRNGISGVSLFAKNYESPAQVAELCNSLQEIAIQDGGLPLAIAVDHEGGRVQRFRKPFTHFPEPRVVGNYNSPKLTFDVASVMARELHAVGVNVSYAPLADIHTNPANPVIGRRAFGESEERVSKMVSAYIRGLLTNHIQPVVKHFPGHGDTSQDSHFHLPKVSTKLETLLSRELRPFQRAFRSHCQMVMTAHILVECLDGKLPATLSKYVLQDLLRDKLHYKGLIISDDMEMKAIADNFGEADAALMALAAGCDILLYHTEPVQTRVFEELLAKLTSPSGHEALNMLKAASARVSDFRHQAFADYSPVDVLKIPDVVGCPAHLELVSLIHHP